MDTLWASLLALFGIAVGMVLLFNGFQSWQDRRRENWKESLAGPGAESASSASAKSAEADAVPELQTVLEAQNDPPIRVEPTLGDLDESDHDPLPTLDQTLQAADPDVIAQGLNSGVDEEIDAGTFPEGLSAPQAASDTGVGAVLDPRFDCIVTIRPGTPVSMDRVLSAVSGLRRAGSKPVVTEVDRGDGHWLLPQAAQGSVRQLRVGVLLANRNGPLNAMEFSDFGQSVRKLGESLGAGGAVVPEMSAVLEQARRLDETCAQFDAVLGVNVLTPTDFSPDALSALASGLGLLERGNNRYAALGEAGEVLFSLALGDTAGQLTLLLDVPRAPDAAQPWGQMLETARACAQRTGGQVVDDAGRPMTEAAAAAVARQLQARYASLAAAGLAAGSATALRVFN